MQGELSGKGLFDTVNGAVSGYRSITAQFSSKILVGQPALFWIVGLVVVAGLGFGTAYAVNEYREHWAIVALQRGNQVIYMRHADRFAGPKENLSAASTPHEYLDCSTQRNLTPKGREQARELGRLWRALNIPVGKVYANAQCRTRDTAELAFGKAEVDPRIFDIAFVRALLLQTPTDGTNTILVGNDYQLHELTGLDLGKGEAALIAPDGRGGIKVVTVLELDDWPDALAGEKN